MSGNLDGLNYTQARLLRRMIGRVIRRKCGCAILTDLTCFRCREIAELRAAFPENWAIEADLNAQMGPQS